MTRLARKLRVESRSVLENHCNRDCPFDRHFADNPKFGEIVPSFHRQENCIPWRPPNGLRGSHCWAAAFAALSCGRDRVRWPVSLPGSEHGRPAVEPAASFGWPARPARSCCTAWIAGDTRETLCGPRSTAPRAAPAPSSGEELLSWEHSLNKHGTRGFRATRRQDYRQASPRAGDSER